MQMKEEHMKNGQFKPAYNVQIGVEGEYIVGIDISSEISDQLTFIPFLDKLEKNLNKKYKSIIADAGYESCLGCEYKNKCTKAKNNRQLHVTKEFLTLRSESLSNITTKEGIRLRINRSIQVEGA
jgi:hypothetical protein